MSNPAAFIHAGLGKCGSSFLQQVWSRDPACATVNLLAAGQAARRYAVAGHTGKLPQLDHGLKAVAGQTLIASSEALSWSFMDRPARQYLLPELQRMAASLAGNCALSDTVLFMVRNPVDWIRAAREQTLKEGGSETGSDFIRLHRGLVEHVLDLAGLQAIFGTFFKRVVFLSADEMRHEPEHFWSVYAEVLGVPAPAQSILDAVLADDRRANRSLGARQAWLARLNRQTRAIADLWAELEGLSGPAAHARTQFIAQFRNGGRWAARRLAEHASDATLEAVFDVNGPAGLTGFKRQCEIITRAWDELAPVPGHVKRERTALLFEWRTGARGAASQIGEFGDAAALAQLDAIRSAAPDSDPDSIPLDADLRAHLLQRFCDTLEGCGTVRPETMAGYRAALA
tara:strand:+ start:572 stop:1771 length:1200 start_codon:yes stop_codon:yes gene_type:complete